MTDLSVVVGRTETGRNLSIDFGAAWHTAIQGQTRSGKSVLTYVCLSQLSRSARVVIAGCDPTGILLNPFSGASHKTWRSLGNSDMAAHRTALHRIVDEMDLRIARLREQNLDKMIAFTPSLPLVVVVMEEYPGLLASARAWDLLHGLKPGERVEPAISHAVGRLVRESAKAGMRVLLLAQRMSAQSVDTESRSQFGCRISLRLDNSDAVKMLHDNLPANLLDQFSTFDPGVGVIDAPGIPRERFRTDMLEYADYVVRVHRHYPPTSSPLERGSSQWRV
ncbi:S-DNA-T family DNA segregation ATPase FtsK/SpoIIIE [Arthrobacter sp. CAN_A212]|uniref:FtsK/SpoIIIE domain-containing protein n=1 Tax=Arthrobacter sp. CAN_A212 TaxID=2787719 RepID=UPI001A2E553E